jgi:hypothetical protein
MTKSLPLGLAQEKFERDGFVLQTALRVGFFVARLRAHTHISDLVLGSRSSTRLTTSPPTIQARTRRATEPR